MTIYELDDILAIMDYEKICKEIESRGFRRAGEVCVEPWEFNIDAIHKKSGYHQSAVQKDEFNKKEYYGTLYKDNEVYEGLTFISLTLFVALPKYDYTPLPTRGILFTDAPYNPYYVLEMNSPYKCDRCGKEDMKRNLSELDDKYYCDHCFVKTMDRNNRIYRTKRFFKKLVTFDWKPDFPNFKKISKRQK